MITIIGPTACGKTAFAVKLAKRFLDDGVPTEIISGDSRQVYRGMTLGTGKDLEEYDGVPYHLIDICDPGEKYNIHRYQQDFLHVYEDCIRRCVQPILCGGSGLYIESVLDNYIIPPKKSEEERERRHRDRPLSLGKKGTPLESVIIGLQIDRELRREKISRRLKQRLEDGMLDEIRKLLQTVSAEDLIYYGLEYKYLTEHVIGRITYEEMFSQLEIAIHQFAKRQMTWFRGMERRGFNINWIDTAMTMEQQLSEAMKIINS